PCPQLVLRAFKTGAQQQQGNDDEQCNNEQLHQWIILYFLLQHAAAVVVFIGYIRLFRNNQYNGRVQRLERSQLAAQVLRIGVYPGAVEVEVVVGDAVFFVCFNNRDVYVFRGNFGCQVQAGLIAGIQDGALCFNPGIYFFAFIGRYFAREVTRINNGTCNNEDGYQR
ncbi:conserved hypothetical protein, partial [Ricinus communis]